MPMEASQYKLVGKIPSFVLSLRSFFKVARFILNSLKRIPQVVIPFLELKSQDESMQNLKFLCSWLGG